MGEKEGKTEKKEKKVEKNKDQEKKKNVNEEEEEEKKKKKDDNGGLSTVVLKIEMHCEGCALKIKKSVKSFEGVDAVTADVASSRLTVIGRVDPLKIRERVESKTRKKVDLISPVSAPKKGSEPKKPQAQVEPKEQKKPEEKKPKEPAASTVVLKIRLHCQGCIRKIRRKISKVKGVEIVNIDLAKDLVTVKGTMDANHLSAYLKDKVRRSVEIVPQKKEGGGGEKKGKDEGKRENGSENKGKDGGKKENGGEKKGREGEKKKKNKEEGSQQKEAPTTTAAAMAMEGNKMELYGPYAGYRTEMVLAPQLFSDENPNACSIM